MQVLGIVGSPRKGGNTDILVSEILAGAKEKGAKTKKIYLNDLSISACQACMHCKEDDGCRIEDDMQKVYKDILKSDVLILGSPVYWFTVSAQMKLFLDRVYALLDKNYQSKISGKKAVLVFAQADPDTSNTVPIVDMFKKSFEFLGLKLVGKLAATADEKGEVAKKKAIMSRARKLGAKIASLK